MQVANRFKGVKHPSAILLKGRSVGRFISVCRVFKSDDRPSLVQMFVYSVPDSPESHEDIFGFVSGGYALMVRQLFTNECC